MQPSVAELIDEIRLAFHCLTNVSERLTGDLVETSGRAVLEHLSHHGATTVPDIARARGVSRQHIQTIVNSLSERDLVTTEPNPSHRRSHRIALTPSGDELIRTVLVRERDALGPTTSSLTGSDITTSIDTLRRLRVQLDQIASSTETEEPQ
ncbi:MAG: MarR family transcriptional regulator [Ilumatobacteraceae bacterium]